MSQFTAKGEHRRLAGLGSGSTTGVSNIAYRQSSNWSADRLRANDRQFEINDSVPAIYFTGEMVSLSLIHI